MLFNPSGDVCVFVLCPHHNVSWILVLFLFASWGTEKLRLHGVASNVFLLSASIGFTLWDRGGIILLYYILITKRSGAQRSWDDQGRCTGVTSKLLVCKHDVLEWTTPVFPEKLSISESARVTALQRTAWQGLLHCRSLRAWWWGKGQLADVNRADLTVWLVLGDVHISAMHL